VTVEIRVAKLRPQDGSNDTASHRNIPFDYFVTCRKYQFAGTHAAPIGKPCQTADARNVYAEEERHPQQRRRFEATDKRNVQEFLAKRDGPHVKDASANGNFLRKRRSVRHRHWQARRKYSAQVGETVVSHPFGLLQYGR
jgi:hypothetical protein